MPKICLLYEYRDLREVFGWNKIRISLHTIFFTCEKTRISALIGRTIFFHLWKKSYQRFDWLTLFNTCSQANVNMESDFVNLLRRDLWYFVYKKSRKIMKKYICGFIKITKTNRQMVRNFVLIFRLYFVVRQYIKYLVSLCSSLYSYNKQITSWLVRLYDFYYSLVVKDR